MDDVHPLVLLVLQVGMVATALTALFALIEKVWSPLRRLLERSLTEPLLDKIEQHEEYVRYHLGPNGTTSPLHTRIGNLESTVDRLTALDIRRRNQ